MFLKKLKKNLFCKVFVRLVWYNEFAEKYIAI